jgi:hypothetical protein
MADLEYKIKVSVEACINKALLETMQQIYDEHKILISSVDVLWLDTSTMESKDRKAVRVCLQTEFEE